MHAVWDNTSKFTGSRVDAASSGCVHSVLVKAHNSHNALILKELAVVAISRHARANGGRCCSKEHPCIASCSEKEEKSQVQETSGINKCAGIVNAPFDADKIGLTRSESLVTRVHGKRQPEIKIKNVAL